MVWWNVGVYINEVVYLIVWLKPRMVVLSAVCGV